MNGSTEPATVPAVGTGRRVARLSLAGGSVLLLAGAAAWFAAPAAVPVRAQEQQAAAAEPAPEGATVEERLKQRRREEQARQGGGGGAERDGSATRASESRGPRAQQQQPLAAPSDAEWNVVVEAMREHVPNWWERFESLPADAPRRVRMMHTLVERYRELRRAADRDPGQYDREIELVELEDEVFGLARQLWREPPHDEAQTTRASLREKVAKLVDARIRNREARIARIARTLEAERRRLETDKSNRDAVVERQFNAVVNRQPIPGVPGGGPNPNARDGRGPLRPDRGGPPTPTDAAASPDTPKTAPSR